MSKTVPHVEGTLSKAENHNDIISILDDHVYAFRLGGGICPRGCICTTYGAKLNHLMGEGDVDRCESFINGRGLWETKAKGRRMTREGGAHRQGAGGVTNVGSAAWRETNPRRKRRWKSDNKGGSMRGDEGGYCSSTLRTLTLAAVLSTAATAMTEKRRVVEDEGGRRPATVARLAWI